MVFSYRLKRNLNITLHQHQNKNISIVLMTFLLILDKSTSVKMSIISLIGKIKKKKTIQVGLLLNIES